MHKQIPLSVEKEVAIYMALTFSFSSIFYYLIATIEDNGWYHFGLMWCPGVAAILLNLYLRKNLKGFDWGPGRYGLVLVSYFFPIVELFIVYGIIWQLLLGEFAGFETNFITKLAFFPMILMILEGTYFAGRSALGEEIGWRGYLTPKLIEKYSPNQTSIFIGLVWAIWHFPIMVTGDYGSNTPLLYQLFCFTLMIVGNTFVYTWFRLKSKSMWSAVMLHTTGNLFIFHVFEPLTIDNGNTLYFAGETGLVYALWGSMLSFLFLYFGWDWPTTLKNKLINRRES